MGLQNKLIIESTRGLRDEIFVESERASGLGTGIHQYSRMSGGICFGKLGRNARIRWGQLDVSAGTQFTTRVLVRLLQRGVENKFLVVGPL